MLFTGALTSQPHKWLKRFCLSNLQNCLRKVRRKILHFAGTISRWWFLLFPAFNSLPWNHPLPVCRGLFSYSNEMKPKIFITLRWPGASAIPQPCLKKLRNKLGEVTISHTTQEGYEALLSAFSVTPLAALQRGAVHSTQCALQCPVPYWTFHTSCLSRLREQQHTGLAVLNRDPISTPWNKHSQHNMGRQQWIFCKNSLHVKYPCGEAVEPSDCAGISSEKGPGSSFPCSDGWMIAKSRVLATSQHTCFLWKTRRMQRGAVLRPQGLHVSQDWIFADSSFPKCHRQRKA